MESGNTNQGPYTIIVPTPNSPSLRLSLTPEEKSPRKEGEKVSSAAAPTQAAQLDAASIPKTLIRSKSLAFDKFCTSVHGGNVERRVLVLYTGGTIGMVRNEHGVLAPKAQAMEQKIRSMCTMHDEEYAKERFSDYKARIETTGKIVPLSDVGLVPLVLPHVPNLRRVIYAIYEYEPLLDSSNMTMDDWIQIANDIQDSYELFDGFVILHGTDTLAYTASALSFMLENLGKPVILTGSQIPAFETRSDGHDNFVGALILAANFRIPEVTVFFRQKLFRGNRTVKVDSESLEAFHSPNLPPLATLGIEFEVDHRSIIRPSKIGKLTVHSTLSRDVVLLRLFPSMRCETIVHFFEPPIEGVVIQCYGSGNVPSNRPDLTQLFRKASERGVIIVSVTQCIHGSVNCLYETGRAMLECGVIPGADMTPEAALTKLSYVLSKSSDANVRRKMMQTNLVGEMTMINYLAKQKYSTNHTADCLTIDDDDLVKAVMEVLKEKAPEEIENLEEGLFPAMMCSAASTGNIKRIEALKAYGGNVSSGDHDGRTPLHVAASTNHLDVMEYLLKNGANIEAQDRNDQTPLIAAIEAGNDKAVKMLLRHGASLKMCKKELGERLIMYARRGRSRPLFLYLLAGADPNITNRCKQTILHAAVEVNDYALVEMLCQTSMDLQLRDLYGRSALDLAIALNRRKLINIFEIAKLDSNISGDISSLFMNHQTTIFKHLS